MAILLFRPDGGIFLESWCAKSEAHGYWGESNVNGYWGESNVNGYWGESVSPLRVYRLINTLIFPWEIYHLAVFWEWKMIGFGK